MNRCKLHFFRYSQTMSRFQQTMDHCRPATLHLHAYCQNCAVIRQINTNIKLAKQPAGIFLYLIPVHLRVIQQCLLSIVLLSAGLFLISCPESCIFPLLLMQHYYQKAQPKITGSFRVKARCRFNGPLLFMENEGKSVSLITKLSHCEACHTDLLRYFNFRLRQPQ